MVDHADLHHLLVRTTPADLDPVHVPTIARAARRRQLRTRVAAASGGAVALAALGGALVATNSGEARSVTRSADSPVDPARPTVGGWRPLPAAPFAGIEHVVPLSDGRLLAWSNGQEGFDGSEPPGPHVATFDPRSKTWEEVAPPKIVDRLSLLPARVAADRLLLVGFDTDGSIVGEVYDARARSWTGVPPLQRIKVDVDAYAWDGDRLVVVRTAPGAYAPVRVGAARKDPSAPGGTIVDVDYRVTAPQTWRWTRGDATWQPGAAPPLGLRVAEGSAFDGQHLAVIGGTTDDVGTPDESLTRADGAIYDVRDDVWTPLPDLPWPAVHPDVGWIDGGLVAAGGTRSLEQSNQHAPSPRVAQLSADDRWSPLPSAPDAGAGLSWSSASDQVDVGDPIVVRSAFIRDPAHPEGRMLFDGSWEQTPTMSLHRWQNTVVATSDRLGNPGDGPFEVRIRRGAGDWQPAPVGPFANRMAAGVVVTGDSLFVVGGLSGASVKPDRTAWVLALSGS